MFEPLNPWIRYNVYLVMRALINLPRAVITAQNPSLRVVPTKTDMFRTVSYDIPEFVRGLISVRLESEISRGLYWSVMNG